MGVGTIVTVNRVLSLWDRTAVRRIAQQLADEVLSLYCSGPAGGAGVRQHIAAQVGTASILIDRARVRARADLVAES